MCNSCSPLAIIPVTTLLLHRHWLKQSSPQLDDTPLTVTANFQEPLAYPAFRQLAAHPLKHLSVLVVMQPASFVLVPCGIFLPRSLSWGVAGKSRTSLAMEKGTDQHSPDDISIFNFAVTLCGNTH